MHDSLERTHSVQVCERVVHGALDYAELARLGIDPREIVDFSVNANPYGPAPGVREAIAHMVIDRYPDRECLQLRQAILRYELAEYRLPLSALICGNGASELIWMVARACLVSGDKVGLIAPTFGEYAVASVAAGAEIVEWRVEAEEDFRLGMDNLCSWVMREQPALLWLCNPNNPTGAWSGRQQVMALAELCRMIGTVLVIDESYHHFVFPTETFSAIEMLQMDNAGHLLVIRSLTKDFALAGLRLGYAVGSPVLIARLGLQMSSWNVNSFAQAAGCAALADRDYFSHCMGQIVQEREDFFQALNHVGVVPVPSRTHFYLLNVGDAGRVRAQLLRQKLLVRDCASFDLPQYIRVSTRPEDEWKRLVRALSGIS